MKREQLWNIRVDGTRHEVYAEDKGNSYDVFVDGEFRFNIRSDINLDVEEDLTVGSKRCRFVVYGGVPDLAVDGILLNAEAELVKADRRSRFLTVLGGIFLIVLGIAAIWAWIIIYANGETHFGGLFGPVFAALVFAAGIWLIIRAMKKRDY